MRLLTVSEVAHMVGLSEWAVRRAIHSGQLLAYKPRGRLRISEADLELWLEGTRVKPAPPAPTAAPAHVAAPASVDGGTVRDRIRSRRSA